MCEGRWGDLLQEVAWNAGTSIGDKDVDGSSSELYHLCNTGLHSFEVRHVGRHVIDLLQPIRTSVGGFMHQVQLTATSNQPPP